MKQARSAPELFHGIHRRFIECGHMFARNPDIKDWPAGDRARIRRLAGEILILEADADEEASHGPEHANDA